MNQKQKYQLAPSIFDETFFPNFLRHFSLFDDENLTPVATSERSNISLSEDDQNVYIEANVPGVPEKDIEVTLEKGVLWVKGEAKDEEKNEKRKYYYKSSRSFSYRVAIPGHIDESKSPTATYENGVIKIAFPKQEKETPKKIQISKKS